VLSIIIGQVGALLLCYIPPVIVFITYPRIIHVSLYVCSVSLKDFHHWKDSALAFPMLVTKKTLNSTSLRVDIEYRRSLSGLLLGYCWVVVYCRQIKYMLAQLVMWQSRWFLVSSHYSVFIMDKPCILNWIVQITQSLSLCLITWYCLINKVTTLLHVDAWVCMVSTTCLVDWLIHNHIIFSLRIIWMFSLALVTIA
jgi:hypothetical protein